MAGDGLPSPVTITDTLLVALVDEIKGLRADLAARSPVAPRPAAAGQLREPKPAGRSRKRAAPPAAPTVEVRG